MKDSIEKEIEKTEAFNKLIYKNLDNEKKIFINKLKEDLGNKIIEDLKSQKKELIKKPSFWNRLWNILK